MNINLLMSDFKLHMRAKKKELSKNLAESHFPKMLNMCVTAQPEFFMVTQQSSFLHHAKLSLFTNNLNKSALPHWSIGYDFPLLFLICAHNMIFLKIEIFLGKRMVNVVTLLIFMMGFAGL
jgi:hypothetical protein